jgi:hypothetical protein
MIDDRGLYLEKAKLVWCVGGANDERPKVAQILFAACDSKRCQQGSQPLSIPPWKQ